VDVDPASAPTDFLGEYPPLAFLGECLLADLLAEEDFASAGEDTTPPSLLIEERIDDVLDFLGEDRTGPLALSIEDSLVSPAQLFSFFF